MRRLAQERRLIMPPRGRNPFQQPFGMGQQNHSSPFQFAPPNRGGSFQQHRGFGHQGQRGGGGILSKLLQKGQGANQASRGIQGFERVAQGGTGTGSMLQNVLNPGSINSFLNNTQQVLKTAQQVGPMVQQYGPMVKNLPAMWKLYRGFKDAAADDDDNTNEPKEEFNEESSDTDNLMSEEPKKNKKRKKIKKTTVSSSPKPTTEHHGSSKPKLYI
jgi:Sec-independent protein translocase protein TatA